MTGFLLDTNVVSADSPTKLAGGEAVKGWVEAVSASTFISAITVMELTDGVVKLGREHPGRRARLLAEWLEVLIDGFGDRLLSIDQAIADTAGRLIDRSRSRGFDPGLADALIAATALRHELVVATLNVKHFRPFDVPLFEPGRISGP